MPFTLFYCVPGKACGIVWRPRVPCFSVIMPAVPWADYVVAFEMAFAERSFLVFAFSGGLKCPEAKPVITANAWIGSRAGPV